MFGRSRTNEPVVWSDFMRSRQFILLLLAAIGIIFRLYICYVNAPTIEETHSVVSGIYGLRAQDFRLSDNRPPVAEMLGVLPSLAMPVELPPLNQFHRFSEIDHTTTKKVAQSFIVTNSSLFFPLVFLSRMVTVLWWTIGAWLICRWSYELYGEKAQAVALILWCFEPNILARSCLATPTLFVTLACIVSAYLFQEWLEKPSMANAFGAGFSFGIAQLADFTALLLVVLWPILVIAHRFGTGQNRPSLPNFGTRVAEAAFCLVTSLWIINLGYGFSETGFPLREKFPVMNSPKESIFRLLGSLPVPLPSDYFDGIASRMKQVKDLPSTIEAWTDGTDEKGSELGHFSLLMLVAKIPVGLWLLVPWSLALALYRAFIDPQSRNALTLWFPLAIIPLMALAGPGLLTPSSAIVVALAFITLGVSGIAATMAPGQGKLGRFALVLIALTVTGSVVKYPRPLAFINEIVALTGGMRAEVSLTIPADLGQDVIPLKAWLDRHPEANPLGLACRHVLDPSSYGLFSTPPPVKPGPWVTKAPWHAPRVGPVPGYYALDLGNLGEEAYSYFLKEKPIARVGTSTYVFQITEPDANRIRKSMDLPSLQDIRALDTWLTQHRTARPLGLLSRHALDPRTYRLEFDRPPINPGPELANAPWYTLRIGPFPGYYVVDVGYLQTKEYDYFSTFTPMETIGSSFNIYHLSPQDVDRARAQLGLPRLSAQSANGIRERGQGFLQKDFVDSQDGKSHYAVFIPSDYDGKKPYPLILFLHGAGDAGIDGRQYLAVGFPPFVEKRKDSFGFIALCPQGQSGGWPAEGDDTKRAIEILDRVQQDYNVDPRRIYLTGLSSGGQGVWEMAARYPERWAAIVPVSSGGCRPDVADKIKDIPCWCFHNLNDKGCPPDIPRKMIKALREAGGHPRYSEFPELFVPGARHNAWDGAYNYDDLYQWLILQSSPQRKPQQPPLETSANTISQ